jgi:hypothetical protein
MSDKKHIDRLFQEKLKDFEAKPSANVWAGIESELNKSQEKTKTILPFWLRFAGIAAALVLLLTVGNLVFNNNKTESNNTTIVDNDTESKNSNTNTESNKPTTSVSNKNLNTSNNNVANKDSSLKTTIVTIPENDSKNESTSKKTKSKAETFVSQNSNPKATVTEKNVNTNRYTTNKNSKRVTANTKGVTNLITPKKQEKYAKNNSANNIEAIPKSETSSNTISTNQNKLNSSVTNATEANNATSNTAVAITNSEKEKEEEKMMEPDSANSSNTIEEALAKIEDLDEKEEDNVNRWSVNVNAAPVYYNTLGKGSHIHDQFINNPKNGEINTSYGVNVGYALNNKLKVRSGINKLNLSYDTANVIVYENVTNTPSRFPMRNINFIPTRAGENISVLSTNSLSIQHIDNFINDDLNAALSQRISYFEVPLELEYTIVNKRFGINLIGGFSTFILNGNDVVTEVDNRKTKIGEANNINDLSFSANAGIGIGYDFSKSLKFNLEPTFKYQINAYSETSGDFRPYIIGVYTGFSYKF